MVATDGCLWSVQGICRGAESNKVLQKLPDVERKYEAGGQIELDLKHTEEQKEALVKNRMTVTALTMAFWDNEDQYCMMNMVYWTQRQPIGQVAKLGK